MFLADGLYGKPVVPTGWKEDRMSQTQDTIVAALMEQLIAEGPEGMAQVLHARRSLRRQ